MNPIQNDSSAGQWLQAHHAQTKAQHIVESEDIGLRGDPNGVGLFLKRRSGGGGGASSIIAITLFGTYDNYLFGTGVEDGLTYYAALPWTIRRSAWDAVAQGDGSSAAYTSHHERRVTGSIGGVPVTEIQRVTPSYGSNEVVLIARIGNAQLGGMRTSVGLSGVDSAIEWIDLNNGAHAWAAVAVISGT
jgi:hypothetical protein